MLLCEFCKFTVGAVTESLESQFFNPFTANPIKALHFATIFYFRHSGTLVLRTKCQSARMSKIKDGGLDWYGTEPFEQQQFGTVGIEGVNNINNKWY